MDRIKILIGEDKPDIIETTKTILEYKGYLVTIAKSETEFSDKVIKGSYQLLILDLSLPGVDSRLMLEKLKKASTSRIIPIIVLTNKSELEEKVSLLESGADDFIIKPFDLAEFVARVNTIVRRNYYNLDASPLTKLPGNQSIIRKIEENLRSQNPFAVCYIDLNNFKAYNDKYGFSKGDEVIKRTAQIILDVFREIGEPEDFVGHIGGDDFILVSKPGKVDEICLKIIDKFDKIIVNFYDSADLARGGINVEDRRGHYSKFDIMSISVGAITNENTKLTHIGQISALASELKKYAKSFEGSAYVKDRRVQEKLETVKIEDLDHKGNIDKIGVFNDIMDNRRIDILLQPIVDLTTSEIFGHEAFCRGPVGSVLEYPNELFRVARIMDKAWELDHICLEKALVIAKNLKENIKYFVNVALETWLNPKSKGKDFFASPILKPGNTFFEVKLSDLITDFSQYKMVNDFFRAKGFGLSVDNFGEAGFKILGYMDELKPNFIKLDFSVIRGINNDKIKQKTLKIMIDVFGKMGITLIAEQVETREEKEYIAKIGIKYAQGYLFARPEKFA